MLVGCVPNSPDFCHPADRRRYMFYFEKRGLRYEQADFERPYDYVYVSLIADLNRWSHYKLKHTHAERSPKVIFDLSDSYLSAGRASDTLRPIFHFFTGRTRSLTLSYKESILKMLAASDVVLCGSEEQRQLVSRWHSNVVVMRDYFGKDIRTTKSSYAVPPGGPVHILWEGLSHGNLKIFRMLRRIVDGLDSHRVQVHIITDPTYCRFGGRQWCRPTFSVLREVFAGSRAGFHLYDWSSATFSGIAASCDLALIPIPHDPVMEAKPENKLLLLWSVGVPAVTTRTPSYGRVMDTAGLDYTCSADTEWRAKVSRLISAQDAREKYMAAAARYVTTYCSEDVLLKAWDRVFARN